MVDLVVLGNNEHDRRQGTMSARAVLCVRWWDKFHVVLVPLERYASVGLSEKPEMTLLCGLRLLLIFFLLTSNSELKTMLSMMVSPPMPLAPHTSQMKL